MSGFVKGFLALCVAIVLTLVGIYIYELLKPEPPIIVTDKLCQFVRNEQKMECVAVLASDTFMKPGAIVDYHPPAPDRVSLPVADLMGDACRMPGVDLASLKSEIKRKEDVSIPQFTYQVNHGLKIGADVEIPKLSGFTFKAGPSWSDVSKIELATGDAWAITLDEFQALAAYGSCKIKKQCTDYVRSQGYRVVGTALVADKVSYRVYNKSDQLISLEAAAKSGAFTANVGGSTDAGSTADATVKAFTPRVVGVRLLPATIFEGQQTCESDVVFEPSTGQVQVSISGGGGKGSIGPVQTQQKPIGQLASLTASGTEESECDPNFERERSGGAANARVDDEGEGRLRFSYDLRAEGGHYVTKAACVGDTVIGKTGHDTTATATAELIATVFVLLRSEDRPPLNVSYSDMPEGAKIEMYDWQSKRLQTPRTEFVRGDRVTRYEDTPPTVSGTGSMTVATRGPGLYRVEVTLRLNSSVTGNANENKPSMATLHVTVGK